MIKTLEDWPEVEMSLERSIGTQSSPEFKNIMKNMRTQFRELGCILVDARRNRQYRKFNDALAKFNDDLVFIEELVVTKILGDF